MPNDADQIAVDQTMLLTRQIFMIKILLMIISLIMLIIICTFCLIKFIDIIADPNIPATGFPGRDGVAQFCNGRYVILRHESRENLNPALFDYKTQKILISNITNYHEEYELIIINTKKCAFKITCKEWQISEIKDSNNSGSRPGAKPMRH